jgi:putative transposase
VLAQNETSEILIVEWRAAHEGRGWAVGRYVIMPDHVHFFCRPEPGARKSSEFIGPRKSWTSRKMNALRGSRSATAAPTTGLWQREFFVLRSNESYSQKWNYVFDNPVRAGLVSTAQEWKYAGEIETLCCSRVSLTAANL